MPKTLPTLDEFLAVLVTDRLLSRSERATLGAAGVKIRILLMFSP